jgi:hypothetical protein
MRFHIKGFDKLFGNKCPTCGNPLPHSPDYMTIQGEDVAICNDCGDVLDAMNTMKTGETDWFSQ